MSNSFNLMDENPNLGNGSNGCLCSELGNADTKGPFIVFAATETDNIFAPFPVLCAPCAMRAGVMVEPEIPAFDPREGIPVSVKPNRKPKSWPETNLQGDEDGPSI